ncbi:TonB-dependent receptor [Paracoccus sp. S3-43]|uniref:TonB-dependent receptor domain-containing protein n=1 Tax=Paracoccus sp. S3-43 TaxID=3030011 RepID=UPI0023AE7A02|nr:TonB-dependent receptor [Paracoccus sp. S3-43]WEF25584.1 TonB-dependent receptor [Paracoccus sp. S3-43]
MRMTMRAGLLGAAVWVIPAVIPAVVLAQDAVTGAWPFVLGTIVLTADAPQDRGGTSSTISDGDMLFYSKVADMIQSVPTGALDDEGGPITQSRNVGDGTYKGFEIAASWDITDRIGLVANYTWLDRDISDPVLADLRPTDTPRQTAFLRLDWRATDRLTVSPSPEVSGSRLSESAVQPEDPTLIAYTRMDGSGLANVDVDWQATDRASVVFGVRNIFDRDHQLVVRFPG